MISQKLQFSLWWCVGGMVVCFISGFLIIYLINVFKIWFLVYSFWFGNFIHNSKTSIKVLPLCTLPSIVSDFFYIKTKLFFFQAFLCSFPLLHKGKENGRHIILSGHNVQPSWKKKSEKGRIFLPANSKVKEACTYICYFLTS